MRKTLVVATVAVLIGLLACSGPAPTPESLGTRPPAESEVILEETATEASGQISTETPDRIDATTAPTTVSPVPKATMVPTRVPTSPTSVPERTIPAPNPTNPGVTAVPTPPTNLTTSVPNTAVATSTPAPIPTTTPASTKEPALPTTTPSHSRGPHPFRDTRI